MKLGRQRIRRSTVPARAAAVALAQGAWELDPSRSAIGFAVPFWWGFGTVEGRFTQYAGHLDLRGRPAIALTIDAASVDTGNPRRDHRLRSDEFFAVNRHPYIRFVSRVVRLQGDRLSVLGDLTARGARIDVEVEATVSAADGEYQLDAETFVMHSGLGLTWNRAGITRPWSKLVVGGRLVHVPAEPRSATPGRRPARACHGPIPAWAWRCPQ
ncbi:MAG TPA: YceI family protein [Solirubrobacteraceae bacterium]|jgi:polyisoprenoid-binding protein YceI